jgi:hypothetical protein
MLSGGSGILGLESIGGGCVDYRKLDYHRSSSPIEPRQIFVFENN